MQPAVTRAYLTLDDVFRMNRRTNVRLNRRYLNPRLTQLLTAIGADNPIARAEGCYFWDLDGRRYLDFLTGFAALAVGHNHPVIMHTLDRMREVPTLIEGLNHFAAALAHNLSLLVPGNLDCMFFANSGTEVVDAAIKLARAATRRKRVLGCRGSFHGRSMAALSIMDREDYRSGFQPLVPDLSVVPFGDLEALERALRSRDVAGFVFEPLQGEAGIVVPPTGI